MPRKLSPRQLAVMFLLISAALSVLALRARNLYDDELLSLELVTSPVRTIVAISNEGDLHPPGMYLLAHAAWQVTHSYRWMNLAPLAVLYAGLSVFVLRLISLIGTTRQQVCFLALATLHPELLIWSSTFRWYSWWTGLALITIMIALQPDRREPQLGHARAAGLGVLLGGLFYLNYITFLFIGALVCAMHVRFRAQSWRWKLARAATIAVPFLVLAAPQARTMITVHLANSRRQGYGLLVSCVRTVQAFTTSEAYLPWHPIAIVATLVIAPLLLCGLVRLLRRQSPENTIAGLHSLAWLTLVFAVLVIATGLGSKPRSALLLVPLLAPAGAIGLGSLPKRLEDATLAFLLLWCAWGTAHILGRHGLQKATMDDRPEQVAAFIGQTAMHSDDPACTVAVTYDSAVAFELAHDPGFHGVIVSPFRGAVFSGPQPKPPGKCTRADLFVVDSYVNPDALGTYTRELNAARAYITGDATVARLSPDPDAQRKRELARIPGLAAGADLPDDRFVVTYGPMAAGQFVQMVRQMPHFRSADAVVAPQAGRMPEN